MMTLPAPLDRVPENTAVEAIRTRGGIVRAAFRMECPANQLEDFVRTPAWRALPMPVKVALVHVWRAEQEAMEWPGAAGLDRD